MKILNRLFTLSCAFFILLGIQAQEQEASFKILSNSNTYAINQVEKSIFGNNANLKVDAQISSWLKDPISGCAVFNSAPKGNETISWSGECQDDKASGYGVLVWLEDGEIIGRFEGTMAEGKAEGHGKLYFKVEDGFAQYSGSFRNSEMSGIGVLLFPDKSRAEGDFAHDNMNGFIKATITEGGSYEGEVKNNLPHGEGHQISPDGEEYYGAFVHGEMEGEGTLLVPNGDIYEGQFKNGLAEGIGTLTTAEYDVYEGQFKNGMPNGEGVFKAANGEVARGQFFKGNPEGKIVFTLKNGKTREEMWKNGKKQ